MDILKVKPCKTIQLGYLIFWIIIIVIPFEIMGVIFSKNMNEFLFGQIIILGFITVGAIVYFCARIFYRSYMIITEEELIKYRRGKVVFKIRKEQIEVFGYRKMSIFMIFLLPLWFLFGDPMCGVLSIRFYHAEVEGTRILDSMLELKSLNEEEKAAGLKEYCECLTAKEVSLICKKLNIFAIKQINLNN